MSTNLTMTDLPARLAERIDASGACWTWDGWHNDAGYPYVHWDGRDQPVHRVVWTLLVGPIADGLELDHLCVNPPCVNPAHHEAVTHAENQRRISERQTSCRREGHDWTDPRNVRTRPNGRRYCAVCHGGGRGHEKKYSDATVVAIRTRHAAGERQVDLAREFDISSGLISRIVNGKYRRVA